MRICKVKTCTNDKIEALGYCNKHYQQYNLFGKVFTHTVKDPSKIILVNDHAFILLTDRKNKVISKTKIDIGDIDKVKKYRWRLSKKYITNSKVGFLHRFLLNVKKGQETDHINRNPLDNRKNNLRICSRSENNFNQMMRPGNTTGYKGVSYQYGKYIVCVGRRCVGRRCVGRYFTLKKAVKIRKQEIEKIGVIA